MVPTARQHAAIQRWETETRRTDLNAEAIDAADQDLGRAKRQ
jgi:hypothetical protein